jgi:hypothetical protein
VTPKASFSPFEGRLLGFLLWFTLALFVSIMVVTWIAAERAHPVMLDLETGKPVPERSHS